MASFISERQLKIAFGILEARAVEGGRAPVRYENSHLEPNVLRQLAAEGMIRFYIYAKNWRVIEILVGPHAGMKTRGPPNPDWKLYDIVPPLDWKVGTPIPPRSQRQGGGSLARIVSARARKIAP